MAKAQKFNSEIGRKSIDEKVKMKLWAISGGRCEMCNCLLYSDQTFGTDGNFGELAHICAVSAKGPRHNEDIKDKDKNNIENLMLLCATDHHSIDTNPSDYGEGFLLERKRKHEERIRNVTDISEDQTCRMVAFFSNLDHQEVYNSERLFKDAVLSAEMIPLQQPVITLHNNSYVRYAATKDNFVAKTKDLETQFKIWFDDVVKTEDAIAVFALAPQPLLFKLGTLINDQYNAQVFQCHRTSHKWAWKSTVQPVEYQIKKTQSSESNKVALVIDLSAEIMDDRITRVIGEECTIIHLTIASPNRLFVTGKAIQDAFVASFRKVMEAIKNHRPEPTEIHIFMAAPNSLVVRAGMDYMPKADLPVILYEQGSAEQGFFEAIRIGGENIFN